VFGIGMSEMLVILGVALLVFGPTELPQIAKKIAKGMREVRRASDDLRRSIDVDDNDDDRFHRPGPPEPPPSITGSALTAESDEGVPAIVPAAAVAVGSRDPDDLVAPTAEAPAVPAAPVGSTLPTAPTEPRRG
jgi:TatA/E family protein of Tat protein translocase